MKIDGSPHSGDPGQAIPIVNYEPAIAALRQSDPTLGNLIDRIGACRLQQSQQTGDLFSSLAKSILYQQLSGKAAASIHRRFLLLFPDQTHPTAIDILNAPDELLRSAGVSRSKVLYLKDLAQNTLNGLPTLDDLEGMDDETIIQTLTQVKGIGRWTVQMLLIFRFHRWDILPVDDLGIRSGVRKTYHLPELPNKHQVTQLGEPWKPYRTIASWYLWRSLEL